ncbi:type I glyceraldehyde-3-phosphate dehydrogenase [Geopsychrobacter electrodiphilus]|uniref:type I glyceraldehyde-3-phosphate dehydrogenase n=1 Tax=Geopsychrobacter electrodiphilus TaxID=225196 RepID=UPI0003657852|nr:type I glyceraldehyde-3-phosphate dehydrogenase [Geopsychrobacter electrodiphilus]
MAQKIAINGFGRIGRNLLRITTQNDALEVVAINDLTDAETLAHLFKYDSVHGTFAGEVSVDKGDLIVNGKRIRIYSEPDPAKLPWKEYNINVVVESTGHFTKRSAAAKHLEAGARRVLISAPGKGDIDGTFCMGINEHLYDPSKHFIISNASCTTNCLAPIAKVLDDEFGIQRGMMTTVHSYTNDQKILDLPHSDLRRGRAAAMSMIPTTTGAAQAVGLVLPQLQGKLFGMAVRVPTPNVSLIDLVINTEREASVESVNAAMKTAAEGNLKGILEYCDLPLVSRDFNGCAASSTYDASFTTVIDGHMVKVLAWYDNEWGYSNRVNDMVAYIAAREN